MPDPVKFMLAPKDHLWSLTRDDQHVADYSHLDRATHEAVSLARECMTSGEPAQVFVQAVDKVIQIDVDPEVTQEEAKRGPDIAQ